MAPSGTGNATPEMRKARVRLTTREPFIESLLAGLDYDGVDIDELRAFSKHWWSARNQFDIRRRGSGLFGSQLIRKRDANQVLKHLLAQVEREGAI